MVATHPAVDDVDDTPSNKQYEELLDVLHRRGHRGLDAYSALMSKETRVLETVDRVVNDARLSRSRNETFMNLSLSRAVSNLIETLHVTYDDLVSARSWEDALSAFTKPERRVYLGLTLMIIASIVMFLRATA